MPSKNADRRNLIPSYKSSSDGWMPLGVVVPKTKMAGALVYTFSLLPRLSRYVLDGRYSIDNNGIENAIRPLALGRKNFLFAGNHEAAVRAAIMYSLFASCKAAGVDIRTWLEDILVRLPGHQGSLSELLPRNWIPLPNSIR